MLNKELFKLGVFVSLILRKENNIFLIKRVNTKVDNGLYSCAGGKVDGNEPITHAAIREAREELGIKLNKEDLKIVHVVHIGPKLIGKEVIGFFVETTKWQGELKNMEPHLHNNLAWFDINHLPKNTMPTLKHTLKMLKKNIAYSEFEWE